MQLKNYKFLCVSRNLHENIIKSQKDFEADDHVPRYSCSPYKNIVNYSINYNKFDISLYTGLHS